MRIYLSFRHENDDVANGSRVVVAEEGASVTDEVPRDRADAGVSPDGGGPTSAVG